jgi:hypothetical protein
LHSFKYYQTCSFFKKACQGFEICKGVIEKLTKYDSTKVNILKKQIPLPKVAKYAVIALSALVYIPLSVSLLKIKLVLPEEQNLT